jgi:thiosulfate dehydrogenase [quinone] large subunit
MSEGDAKTLAGMWPIVRRDGTMATGWVLMPLRLFLGFTFFYAGLQKLANPQFFHAASPISIHAQLVGASHSSPIHALISHLVPISSAVGALIATGEVAIGAGILLGWLTRVAAVAGMALSLGLFLTVSFHSSPYFTGSDIVFFFAWMPLALGGAAGAPALDTWLAARRSTTPRASHGVARRTVLSAGAITAVVAGVVVFAGGLSAALGRAIGGTSATDDTTPSLLGGAASTTTTGAAATTTTTKGATATTGSGSATTTSTTAAPPSGTAIGLASRVPVGGSASFTDPATGDPSLVIQQEADTFVAFDAVCPHAGCTVAYQQSAKIIACPCHGSEFDAATGGLLRGPAQRGLTSIPITKGSDGELYVTS